MGRLATLVVGRSTYRHNLAVAEAKNLLRATSRVVAVSCLLVAIADLLVLFTPGGPATVFGRIVVSTIAAGGTVAGALWWLHGWPQERTSIAFIIAAEVCPSIVLIACSSPLVGLLAAIWFFLMGDYLTFAHGRREMVLHSGWVTVNIVVAALRAALSPEADIFGIAFLAIALFVTLAVAPLYGQLFADALRSDSRRSAALAHQDPLTSLLNRRGLNAATSRLFGQVRAEGGVVAVLLIDIDRFKSVNDAYGHTRGDEVLVLLASRLQQSVRKPGLVARTGGEEFVVIDRVHPDGIRPMAERLRTVCDNRADPIPITVSIGGVGVSAAEFSTNDPGALLSSLIAHADRAMYRAKQHGGNRVALDVPSSAPPAGPDPPGPRIPDEILDRVLRERPDGLT